MVDLERLKDIPRVQLEKMREFVLSNQDILGRVGGSAREMQWFRDVLEWISSSEVETRREQLPPIPPIDQHIIIVGTRGSGKTATGKLLAQRLKVEFTSLDAEWDPTGAEIVGIDQVINAAPSGKAKFIVLDNVSDPSRNDREQDRLRSSLEKVVVFLWIETNGENQVEEVVGRITSKLLRLYLL